jgi:hypothetical protein
VIVVPVTVSPYFQARSLKAAAFYKGNARAIQPAPVDAPKAQYSQRVTNQRQLVARIIIKRFGVTADDSVEIDTHWGP